MGNRFDMGGALNSALSCMLPIGDRLLWEPSFRVVMGDEFWLGLSGLRKLGFEHLSDPLMVVLSRAL